MSQEVWFDVQANVSSQWYGTLVVSNIRRKGDRPLTVKKLLVVKFTSPVKVTNADFWTPLDVTPDVTSQQIGPSTFHVTAKLKFPNPYTFKPTDILNFGINGDLNKDPNHFTQTFTLAADPVGTVNIEPATHANQALIGTQQPMSL